MDLVNPAVQDDLQRTRLFHFVKVQLPAVRLLRPRFDEHIRRSFQIYEAKVPGPLTWPAFLAGLYIVDWAVSAGCLENDEAAWDLLFAARTGRSDCLLVDALRARAARLFPRDFERRETAVTEFWSRLIASDDGTRPVLARYDGQRPLAPWLIRVFQNWHLSKLRQSSETIALPDDDLAPPLPPRSIDDTRWHDAFTTAARDWLHTLDDSERLFLGLRWRYQLSQREIARTLGVHEGTISRQNDKLRERALAHFTTALIQAGWTGDDVSSLIFNELGAVLTDEPALSGDVLRTLLERNQSARSPGLVH
jgi:RNA polymerase sigma factor (sigma-70 family)